MTLLQQGVVDWYATHARDLPWRRPGVSPWGVVVSEFMLQQTPVVRVLPVWETWMQRWPTPASLAAEPAGAAIRAWGQLGYPRRALRLHAAAAVMVTCHAGHVPRNLVELRALPGVGPYTAAAIETFAFSSRRTVVLDTNVRRVLGRLLRGEAQPPTSSVTAAERATAEELLPLEPVAAASWSVAVMELGALVCAARAPRCGACPVADRCRWLASGRPATARVGQTQPYVGTDRQVRGRLLAVLRDHDGPAPRPLLEAAWHEPVQRERALAALVADGLAEQSGNNAYALPGQSVG